MGCLIVVLHDICMSVCLWKTYTKKRMPKCVGGITWPMSVLGG